MVRRRPCCQFLLFGFLISRERKREFKSWKFHLFFGCRLLRTGSKYSVKNLFFPRVVSRGAEVDTGPSQGNSSLFNSEVSKYNCEDDLNFPQRRKKKSGLRSPRQDSSTHLVSREWHYRLFSFICDLRFLPPPPSAPAANGGLFFAVIFPPGCFHAARRSLMPKWIEFNVFPRLEEE